MNSIKTYGIINLVLGIILIIIFIILNNIFKNKKGPGALGIKPHMTRITGDPDPRT